MLKIKSGNDFVLPVLKVYKTSFECRAELQDLCPLTAQSQGSLLSYDWPCQLSPLCGLVILRYYQQLLQQ